MQVGIEKVAAATDAGLRLSTSYCYFYSPELGFPPVSRAGAGSSVVGKTASSNVDDLRAIQGCVWSNVVGDTPVRGPDRIREGRGMKRVNVSALAVALHQGVSSDERGVGIRQISDITPVLTWMCDIDTRFTYFNRYWLDFTGRSFEAELGHGWTDGIHEDDRRHYESTFGDAFVERRPFRTEFRLRRCDDEYRWLLDVGTPMHDEAGSFEGYVGSCLDITDNKLADHALATLSGRLLEAQEQERSRLAAELHDDINQRLALLAIELEQLRLALPHARKVVARRIDDLKQATWEISRNVQALSYELHSSKLDFLGLVPAFASFCREFAQRKQVEIHFATADVPDAVPPDISLCLFRVLQEASRDVVKHSGVRSFDVELRGIGDHVCLSVRDAGKGFESARRHQQPGPRPCHHARATELDWWHALGQFRAQRWYRGLRAGSPVNAQDHAAGPDSARHPGTQPRRTTLAPTHPG